MAKKVQNKGIIVDLRQESSIPVNIGPFEFKLPTSDKKKKELGRMASEMQQKQADYITRADKLKEDGSFEESIELFNEAVQITKDVVNKVLGKGSFEKLFEATGEDTEAVMDAFTAVMEQYAKIQENKKLNKLVEMKKKKND